VKTVSIMIDVQVETDVDEAALAEKLFDFLAEDIDDYFPEIVTVDSYDYKVLG
jgi:hypothetical protein